MNSFPIPVVTIGPGSQQEDVELDYMNMPHGMQTYSMPILPEQEQTLGLKAAHDVLHQIIGRLTLAIEGTTTEAINLLHLDADNLHLLNQVLGEGEVSARVEGAASIQIQESVFAGVWRVIVSRNGSVTADRIEVGSVPAILVSAARDAARPIVDSDHAIDLPDEIPDRVMNAPSIITELNQQIASWQSGMPAHVINLTLLPLSVEDVAFLEQRLVGGSVLILSRGYGNCRIISTMVPNCWRVTYYNSSDAIILNTLEVVDIPDVACAAQEDLQDSLLRLTEVLQWVEGA